MRGSGRAGRALIVDLIDYWRTYRHQGWRSVLTNLAERLWFDWRHGTDTGLPMPRGRYQHKPQRFDHGFMYASSWTSEVGKAFAVTHAYLGASFESWTFIDIGCGKGKVVMQWRQLGQAHGLEQRCIGIDYYAPLVQIAQANHQKVFADSGEFFVLEASAADFTEWGEQVIAYLYNPFDEVVLATVMQTLVRQRAILIYNNPVHAKVPITAGFALIHHQRKTFHVNQETMIFASPSCALNRSPIVLVTSESNRV